MGNNPSSGQSKSLVMKNMLRTGNALGLSKSELDGRCRPSGLYPHCQYDDKTIRKWIGDGKLAARLRGTEEKENCTDAECPICFLNYPQINCTKCCRANLCTECYLQVNFKQQKTCPFCNSKLQVQVSGDLREFQFHMQQLHQAKAVVQPPLESSPKISPLPVQERQQLEETMRSQQHHPLALRLEQEEAERRLRNELQYKQTHPDDRQRSHRYSIEQRHQSRDPLRSPPPTRPQSSLARTPSEQERMVLAAAIQLSIQDRESPSSQHIPSVSDRQSRMEEEQIAMAIQASLREEDS